MSIEGQKMKKLTKFLVSLLAASLMLGLMESYVFAAEKELTPLDWLRLSPKKKDGIQDSRD